MQTRREIIKSGLGLAGIIAAGKAQAALVRSLIAARAALTGWKKLPYDAEVEWLQSTGTQWIDTGTSMKYGDDFELNFEITKLGSANNYAGGYVLASLVPNNLSRSYVLGWYPVNSAQHFLFCFSSDASSYQKFPTPVANLEYIVSCHAERGNMTMTVNGVQYTDTANNTEVSGQLAMFARTTRVADGKITAVNAQSNVKIRSIKHYRSGALINDFIPVRFANELGQSEGAMYNRANPTVGMNPDGSPRDDGLYRNRGTGAFVIGTVKARGASGQNGGRGGISG